MAIKTYKPTTPSRRMMASPAFELITRAKPEKSLVESIKKNSGRNNTGRITSRHRGGGAKKIYRIIDFKRNKIGVVGTVAHIEYDPNRTANIALIQYEDGEKRYILHPVGLNVGDKGGGEGRAPIGRPSPMTPWGKPALGLKTRKKKKHSDKYIIRRRNDK